MKTSLKRRMALMLGLSLAASLSVATAAPAGAAQLDCTTILNTTPGIEADLDGDGNADVRAPRIYDVTLCSEAGASYVTFPPTTQTCSYGKYPTCMAVYVSVLPAHVFAGASGELCFSIEGAGRTCEGIATPTWDYAAPRVICIGYDVNGGHPCAGSVFAFE